ncbi:MAG: sigma-70 family RNA polymerase sigma factor [Anaerolineae bacterium]|nr:sigma-70 family RNA polymerase sigma factor [Anaerolineae bacterium]
MSETNSKYPNDPEQTTWLSQAKQGDRAAFGQIVKKYQRPVYNICFHMLKNPEEAEDAAQEVFLRAYAKLYTYDDNRRYSTWLFSIAAHYCLDCWKKRRFQLISWDNLKDCVSDRKTSQPEKALLETEEIREVHHLLQALRPDYRLIVILKYWHRMSYPEIAQTLDTTVGTIKSKLYRARKMLAKLAIQQQTNTVASDPMALIPSC